MQQCATTLCVVRVLEGQWDVKGECHVGTAACLVCLSECTVDVSVCRVWKRSHSWNLCWQLTVRAPVVRSRSFVCGVGRVSSGQFYVAMYASLHSERRSAGASQHRQ